MSQVRMMLLGSLIAAGLQATVVAAESQVERGKYLVTIASCGDCHTPGGLLGKPDASRTLGGSEVGFEMPGAGVFYGPNLTPTARLGSGAGQVRRSSRLS